MAGRRGPRGAACAAAVVALLAVGCGSSGPEVSSPKSEPAPVTVAAPGGGGDVRTVSYRGVQFDVPADWPVYDLEAAPTTCVRYDTHAVYLGHAGPDMQCPAHLAGRTETVQVEPADGSQTGGGDGADGQATAQDVNGLAVELDANLAAGQLDVVVPDPGVAATFTFTDSDATAREILGTLRKAGA